MSIQTASYVREDDINTLVDEFYARVQCDALIGPIFDEQVKDWPAHLALLKRFWAAMVMGVGRFEGNPLETHLKLKLEPQHFERWLALFRETAMELLPAEKAAMFVGRSQRIAETFQRGIAARRNGLEIMQTRS